MECINNLLGWLSQQAPVPNSMVKKLTTGGVAKYAADPFPYASMTGSHLAQEAKYDVGAALRALNAEMAFGDAHTTQRPGGTPRPFWEAARTF